MSMFFNTFLILIIMAQKKMFSDKQKQQIIDYYMITILCLRPMSTTPTLKG